jgi:SAM-dependent methyltransferase
MTATAAGRWAEDLARWAIPGHILRRAPQDPHAFSVERFTELAADAVRQPRTPTHERAREVLPEGGSVLDVGCGGGAASLPLAPPAGRLVGIDRSADMLAAFSRAAAEHGVAAQTLQGTWPAVAGSAPDTDVVVCAHVVYNVADLAPFVAALTAHARRRVVLELPTRHPLAWLTPYWRTLHGVDRPDGPTSDDAMAVIRDLGPRPREDRWWRPNSLHDADAGARVAFIRARLALGTDRDGDVRAAVDRIGVPARREVITAWWDA